MYDKCLFLSESYNYEIKKSKISGKGIFAKINLDKNNNLGIAFKKISNTGNDDKDYERTKLGQYINHSNSNNLDLMQSGTVFFFVTNREIKKGEELIFDYKKFPWEGKRDFA